MARKPTIGGRLCLPASLLITAGSLFAQPAIARPLASEREFRALPACRPPAPGHVGCLAQLLLPRRPGRARASAAAPRQQASEAGGVTPEALHVAYNLPAQAPTPLTVAVVDAYSDPAIEPDLGVFDRRYGLPECTAADGCLRVVYAGAAPPPSGEWSFEISLDVEMVHAICENCRILLVEADGTSQETLAGAVERAYREGATVITTSFGGRQPGWELPAYNHLGVVITAAAGDNGYLNWAAPSPSERGYVDYPAASPHVVAVGATRLVLGPRFERLEETVWNDSDGATGSGCAAGFAAPLWQRAVADWQAVGCGEHRAVADLAVDGDPYSGLTIYDSVPWNGTTLGWVTAGGTSMASPLVAAAFALAGGLAGSQLYAPEILYEHAQLEPAAFHPITAGANGPCEPLEGGCPSGEAQRACGGLPICTAAAGYSGPAGLGSIAGLAGLRFPAAPETAPPETPSPARHRRLPARGAARLLHVKVVGRVRRRLQVSFRVNAAVPVVLRLLSLPALARDARRARRSRLVLNRRLAAQPGLNALTLPIGRLRPGRYRLSLVVDGHASSAVLRLG